MRAWLRRAVDWRMRAVVDRLDALLGRGERLESRLAGVEARLAVVDRQTVEAAQRLERVVELIEGRIGPVLEAVVAEEGENRRRLHVLRADPAYALPYDEPDPLVSVTLPTRGRPGLLVERALRSLLDQTHEHLEVLVVGDAAGPEVADALAAVDDSRVRYTNLTQRITAHAEERRHWKVGSAMARNEAARRARGRWLLHFDDDDALRPDAVEALLEHARATRAEVVYGGFVQHSPEREPEVRLAFPPRVGQFGWQGALIHGGLRFFERELVAAHLDLFGDEYLLRRMLHAGVTFAMLDRVVWDYYPSTLWGGPSGDGQRPK